MCLRPSSRCSCQCIISDIERMRLINESGGFPGLCLNLALENSLYSVCRDDRLFGSTGQLIRADDMASYRKEQ